MADRIWAHAWTVTSPAGYPRLDRAKLTETDMELLAADIGLDVSVFLRDMASKDCRRDIDEDKAQLSAVGNRGTPAFFINGRYLSGAQPAAAFERIIDEEIAKADEALAGGVKLSDYYDATVVKAGRKSP